MCGLKVWMMVWRSMVDVGRVEKFCEGCFVQNRIPSKLERGDVVAKSALV